MLHPAERHGSESQAGRNFDIVLPLRHVAVQDVLFNVALGATEGGLMGAGIALVYLDESDLSPTPATEMAAPRTVISEARVTRDAGENIVVVGW